MTLRPADPAARVAALAVGAGAFIRILHFVSRRSLWTDEAALAVNIVQRDFGGLLQPLDGNQGAPVVFLWLERLMVLVGGNNEYALRIVPLLAGLALLPLVYVLGRRIGSPAVGAGATVLVAFSPELVRYSTEVKQYSTDALLAVALVLLAVRALDRDLAARDLAVLTAAGAIALWASHPAIFVLAGIGVVLSVHGLRAREWSRALPLVLVGAAWAVSAAALYVVSLQKLEDNEFLTTYWQSGFLPQPLSISGSLRWMGHTLVDVMSDPVGLALPAVAIAACAVGLGVLTRHRPWRTTMLVAALPFLLIAAAVERYPFRGRLVLFLAPLVLIGLSGLLLQRRWRLLAVPVIAVLAASGVADVLRTVPDPPEFAESRPVFEHVRENRRAGDQVWIHDVTIEPYRYYGPITDVDADRRTIWADAQRCAAESGSGRDPVIAAGSDRVWVVFAYTLSNRPDDESERLRRTLSEHAEVVSVFEETDASATLFDFGSGSAGANSTGAGDASAAPPDETACVLAVPEADAPRSGLPTGPLGTGEDS